MKAFHFLPTLVMAVAIVGCSPSAPLSFNQLGEFSAYPLNKQTYRISYTANDNISYSAAQNITLIKAAQTTVQNGYHYFIVMNNSGSVHNKPQKEIAYTDGFGGGYWGGAPGSWGPSGPWGPVGWNDPFYGVPQVVTTGPAEIAYNIVCFPNEQTAPKNAYNASLILQTIGQKYGVSPTGQVIIQQPNQP